MDLDLPSIPNPTNADDPTDPNATRTEREIAETAARLADLQARKVQEDAIKVANSIAIRRLAIALHSTLCPSTHPFGCPWSVEGVDPENPNAADWTREQHARWLEIARTGVGLQLAAGWTVTEPGA